MADSKPETPTNEKAAGEKKSGGNKVVVIGFISIVVLFETAMFFFLVPSAEEISALAEARLVQSVQDKKEEATRNRLKKKKSKSLSWVRSARLQPDRHRTPIPCRTTALRLGAKQERIDTQERIRSQRRPPPSCDSDENPQQRIG